MKLLLAKKGVDVYAPGGVSRLALFSRLYIFIWYVCTIVLVDVECKYIFLTTICTYSGVLILHFCFGLLCTNCVRCYKSVMTYVHAYLKTDVTTFLTVYPFSAYVTHYTYILNILTFSLVRGVSIVIDRLY